MNQFSREIQITSTHLNAKSSLPNSALRPVPDFFSVVPNFSKDQTLEKLDKSFFEVMDQKVDS